VYDADVPSGVLDRIEVVVRIFHHQNVAGLHQVVPAGVGGRVK
jgi:hypothetical protein